LRERSKIKAGQLFY